VDSDSAEDTSRFGTVTRSLAARALRAASSSAVTHTPRRFFEPAGEFARRRFESRERGTSSSDTHPPPSLKAQRSDPDTRGPHKPVCQTKPQAPCRDTPIYGPVNV
jgi:hypothetical protein